MPVITSGSGKTYVELYILKHIRISATKVDPFPTAGKASIYNT